MAHRFFVSGNDVKSSDVAEALDDCGAEDVSAVPGEHDEVSGVMATYEGDLITNKALAKALKDVTGETGYNIVALPDTDDGPGRYPVAPLASQYEVRIKLPGNTASELKERGYRLIAFKAVQSSARGGKPTVWFTLDAQRFGPLLKVSWAENYSGYVSLDTIVPGGLVTASASAPANLGQVVVIEDAQKLTVKGGSRPQAISLYNKTDIEYTCGIAQKTPDGESKPMCALPVEGGHLGHIAPIQRILLVFATEKVNTGTVITQAVGPGLIVDLTTANVREVTYQRGSNWSWGGYSWGTAVEPLDPIVDKMIEVDTTSEIESSVQARSLVSAR
jgi:hypothetical protein